MLHLRHLAGGAAVGASAALFSSDQAARARHPLLLEERRHSKPRSGPAHVAMGRQLASSRFKEGDWFEWEYRDSEGQPSSWERYSVLSTRGDEVLIDMASKMRETDDYQVWHRMHLSLSDSLAASSHPSQWSFRKFGYWQEGKWCPPAAPHPHRSTPTPLRPHLPLNCALPCAQGGRRRTATTSRPSRRSSTPF